jgi:glycosyltransferase involved in cell wall biosynthesis
MPRLSIIVAFLNEEPNIIPLYKRLCGILEQIRDLDVELIFVDDGSTDGSCREVRALPTSGPAIRLVRLSRNFGAHAALAAGISQATGDVLTFLSADLQDPPETILAMLEKWREGYEIVGAVRESRQDPWSSKVFSKLYYGMMRKLAIPQMPPTGLDLLLVDRKVVESLGNLQERNSSISCLIIWSGFSQAFITYHREERKAGSSKWSLGKKLKLFADSFVSFSFFPMRLISALGAGISALGLLWALALAIQAVFFRISVQGWSSLMIAVLLLSGIQLLMLGIISEYLWRALDASRNRPTFIVRDVEALHGKAPAAPAEVVRER